MINHFKATHSTASRHCRKKKELVIAINNLFNFTMGDTNPCCDLEFWAYLIICFILVSLAGITSGLALGLLSFSHVELEVFNKAGLPQDRKNAGKILPLVKNEHLLLCTLLIVKTLAMEALPVFLDPILPTWAAILMSVTLVLAFAEIIPQAVCARYGLSVGAKLSVFVRFLLLVFYPIAYPISKLLDWLLGKAHSALLRRAELKTLVSLHANEAGKGGDLSHHETTIISGALDLTKKTAKDAMTPISESFTLDINSKLDMPTMGLIMSKGHSRVPVYSGSPNNVIGLILVKSLIFCRPEDETPIKCRPIRRIPRVTEDFPLYSILNQFQKGQSHMAVVVKSKKDVKSSVNHEVCKHTKLDIVTRPNPKTTQAEMKANIDDRGISSPFYQTEYPDIFTNASPLYSNNKDYQSATSKTTLIDQNKDQNPPRNNCDKNISESLPSDLDEEVIGIITMEDVLEELLQEEILDETDRFVDLHNRGRINLLVPPRRLSPISPRSISVSPVQWTRTPDQPSPLSSYTPILRSPISPYIVSPLIRPTLYASPGRFIRNSQGRFVGLVRSSPSSHRVFP